MSDTRSVPRRPLQLLYLLFGRYIEVFRSNMVEMQKRSRPPPLMSARPGPYDRPSYSGRSSYSSRNRMRGQIFGLGTSVWVLWHWNLTWQSWWDWSLSQWPTGFLQCFDAVGWVIWPVKTSPKWSIKCRVGHYVSQNTGWLLMAVISATLCGIVVSNRVAVQPESPGRSIHYFPGPGKFFKTDYSLESLRICFKRSLKVFDFQYFIIIVITMWAVSAWLSNPVHLRFTLLTYWWITYLLLLINGLYVKL